MAFRFRFDSILQLRNRQRDEAGVEVGKANEAIRRIDQQFNELQSQRDDLRRLAAGIIAGDQGHATLSVDRMLQQGRYDLQLQAEQMSLRQTRSTLEDELERRRGILMDAEADVKRYERLRATRQAEYTQAELKREQDESDDLTSARMTIAKRKQTYFG